MILEPIDLETEQGRLMLMQLHRYAQVGQCVNGVTHDINNLLGAAMAYAELASFDENISPETTKMLSQIVDGVGKCSHLISTLTSIARKLRPDVNLASPDRVLDDVFILRDYDFKTRQIVVEKAYEADINVLPVDLPQLKLALLHLLLNAQQAVENAADKRVRLTVGNTPDGAYYEVWDSGDGLASENIARAFEPMTSFWPDGGDHFGLGLYAARQVAEHHGGTLTYEPKTGFRLTLLRDNGLLKQV